MKQSMHTVFGNEFLDLFSAATRVSFEWNGSAQAPST